MIALAQIDIPKLSDFMVVRYKGIKFSLILDRLQRSPR